MHFAERVYAVLHGAKPDKVPFAPYDNLVPRGAFARELENRGMGLCFRRSAIWSDSPHVTVQTHTEGDLRITSYVTPHGTVTTSQRLNLGRISDSGSLALDGMIKGPKDYEPVIWMLDDTRFHLDPGLYANVMRDIGTDGVVVQGGVRPAYDATRGYYGSVYGLAEWIYAQQDAPDQFARLMQALERRNERMFPLVLECPAELISLGSVDGQYGPRQFVDYVLPFFQKYVPPLHARGKLCTLHAHASNCAAFADLIGQTGVDVIEAFTPPPIGDLSVADARAAWGPDKVIWVNFPETIFWYGAQETKEYTLDLLRSDPCPNRLVIGLTEMGMYGVTNDESERVFKAGMRAIMDAIGEFSAATF